MKCLFQRKVFSRLSVIFFLFLVGSSCKRNDAGIDAYPKEVTIEYRVTKVTGSSTELSYGSYINASGGTDFFDKAPLPFVMKFRKRVERGEAVSLAFAENNSNQSTPYTLKAEILVNNELKESKSFTSSSPVLGSIAYVFR